MIFVSGGHVLTGPKKDPGAVSNGFTEAQLADEFRDLVTDELKKKGVEFITDKDDESLSQYLTRIKTGSGSVVLEFHFDASLKETATGTTSIVGKDADRLDSAFAKEIVDASASIQSIKNRGVISEEKTHRGSLGLMRESGVVCLLELGFLTNKTDLKQYQENKKKLAVKIAEILIKYEKLI